MNIMEFDGIKIEWLGHSAFRLSDGTMLYIDPYKLPKDMKKSDLFLVTHAHFDHCDVENVKKLSGANATIVAPAGCAQQLAGLNVKPIKAGETLGINGVKIEAVEAYNTNKTKPDGTIPHQKGEGVGFIVNLEGKRIYHAGDTDFVEEMKSLRNIDIALLPIGGSYTMDDKEAAQAANAIKPKFVIPIHYNTFDNIRADPNYFASLVDAGVEVRILTLD